MTKRADRAICLIFSVFLGSFFLLNLFSPDRDFSPNENRYLQPLPSFSLSSLFSGSYTKSAEAYCSDQFALRDQWISMKAGTELLQGKQQNNGVFLCEDQRLLETFPGVDAADLDRRIAAVNQFSGRISAPVVLALIPSAGEIYKDLLPQGAVWSSQAAVIRSVYEKASMDTAELLTTLSDRKDEYIFYRTDHHWTSLGAFYAYQTLGKNLGYEPHEITYYTPETVSESFCGTAYSSSGFFWVKPDSMQRFTPDDLQLRINKYDGAAVTTGRLYENEMLQTKDKYRFFLGGNSPRVVIETGRDDLPSLLIIRDSYTDSLIPFLTEHFSRIHLLDLRYYLDPVSEYVSDNDIDKVLVMYSVDNFCTDKNLALIAQ